MLAAQPGSLKHAIGSSSRKEATLLDDPFTDQVSKPGIFRPLQLAALLDFSANGEKAERHLGAGVFDCFFVRVFMVAGVGFEPTAFRL